MSDQSHNLGRESGRFITIEGIEGGGKSTQLEFIRDFLTVRGKQVVTSREPGGTAIGEALRALLLDPRNDAIGIDTELLMVFAARAEHIAKVIKPALEEGKWVVCDRFTDATYGYQGGGRGIPASRIATLEEWVQGGLHPDLTLILDVPVEVGLTRVGRRGLKDRFEKEEAAFFQRVRDTYLARARGDESRYRVIDTRVPIEEVSSKIAVILKALI